MSKKDIFGRKNTDQGDCTQRNVQEKVILMHPYIDITTVHVEGVYAKQDADICNRKD